MFILCHFFTWVFLVDKIGHERPVPDLLKASMLSLFQITFFYVL